eukprot:5568135-Pyramimonas_sp.AAC.2
MDSGERAYQGLNGFDVEQTRARKGRAQRLIAPAIAPARLSYIFNKLSASVESDTASAERPKSSGGAKVQPRVWSFSTSDTHRP